MNKELNLPVERSRILFKGIVQGVGFRPYLYRSARKFQLSGFVKNTGEGVILEVEGKNLDNFLQYILNHLPPLSEVVNYEVSKLPLQFSHEFEILSSENTDKSDLLVSPDIAVCENCNIFGARQCNIFGARQSFLTSTSLTLHLLTAGLLGTEYMF
jgi:hydrogenase maturation protein HypF